MPHAISAPASPFDEAAVSYDTIESHNSIFQWMRRRVHHAAAETFERGARLLEIGCGTGTDALFFARRGHQVIASDPSAGMLAVAKEKAALAGFAQQIEFKPVGAEQIENLLMEYGRASFDGIFSNFGVLNCVADLRPFVSAASALLRPGGKILLNIMPPVCPWEFFYFLLKLQPSQALRRWRARSGTVGLSVRLGTRRVQTYYHSSIAVRKNFTPAFSLEQQFALGLFLPPPYLQKIMRQRKLFELLLHGENEMTGWPLLRSWGDHVVLILQKRNT